MTMDPPTKGFGGLTVGALESRMAKEMERLIARYGGHPIVAPSMKERPLENHTEALTFGEVLLSRQVDMLIFLTGVGLRTLLDILITRYPIEELTRAFRHTTLLVRGPKPATELKKLGLQPDILVPEPNTSRDLLRVLDGSFPEGLQGLRVAVQEYGVSNPELIDGLTLRGAQIILVPVYRWTLPDNLQPLRDLLQKIMKGSVPVLLVTNAVQVDHMIKVLGNDDAFPRFTKALTRMMVASIGRVASERLHQYSLPVDLEPSHPKMGILVKEASQTAHSILANKAERFDR